MTKVRERTYDGSRGFSRGLGATSTGVLRGIATALFIVSIPILLIATNVRIAANESRLYDYSIERYDAAAVANIPEAELKRANRELIRYFNDDDRRFLRLIVSDNAEREVSLFNPRETAHLADVKNLFQKVFFIQEAALVYALFFTVLVFLWAAEAPLRALAVAILGGSLLTVGAVVVGGLMALVGFDEVWLRFHFLAFANDLWRLDPDRDHLIQMFPRDFWYDATLLIGGFTALEALLLAGFAALYLHGADTAVESSAGGYVGIRGDSPKEAR